MATWQDISTNLTAQFGAQAVNPRLLRLQSPVGPTTKVDVFVGHETLPNGFGDWVQYLAVIGQFGDLDFAKVLSDARSLVVGGIMLNGDTLLLKHAAPMGTLQLVEINPALWLLSSSAAQLAASAPSRPDAPVTGSVAPSAGWLPDLRVGYSTIR
ncbi:hypothetical protein [Salana multivorans]